MPHRRGTSSNGESDTRPMPGEPSSRLVQEPVELRSAGADMPETGRPHEPDLADLAAFTLDSEGLVASWSLTAARLFGQSARSAVGTDVCEAVLAGPGQSLLLRHALAEVAAGRVWTGTVSMTAARGQLDIRCEPLTGSAPGALVIAQATVPKGSPRLPSEAVARIGSTLDITQTAREVLDVAVPGFAELAAIYVPERLLAADDFGSHQTGPPTVVRRLGGRVAELPGAAADSLLPPGEVLALGADSPCQRAMATISPVLFDHLDGEIAVRLGGDSGSGRITAQCRSFLAVPLAARGAVVGCAVFGRSAVTADFGSADLAPAAELAARAALCIDNARLYDRERRTARALQRSLLPGRPHVPAGLEVAHRYLPVGGSMVGGDWHDIVPLPGGRAALIVGDAMGHGPEAAAVMVQLRTAAHTLADLDLPPEQILRRLDWMAAELAAAPFATCIYTVIDPSAGSCVIAQAGHLPPVLALADGGTRVLDLPPGLPLGLRVGSFHATEISLPPGATLALYTDGLVESRTRPFDVGVTALRSALDTALAGTATTLASACETVTQALREHGEDDITLVLARIRQR